MRLPEVTRLLPMLLFTPGNVSNKIPFPTSLTEHNIRVLYLATLLPGVSPYLLKKVTITTRENHTYEYSR